MNVLTGTQDDPSSLSSITGATQDDPSDLISRTWDSMKSSNVTSDKGQRNNLFTSSPLRKYPIHRKETSELYGSKPFNKVSHYSFTEISHYNKSINN